MQGPCVWGGLGSLWRAALLLHRLWVLQDRVWAQDQLSVITPQDCSLDCIQQGGAGCDYCRITRADITNALGFSTLTAFGSCVPRPCAHFLGAGDPHICQHYVHAPNDVEIQLLDDPDPTSDTAVVSWRPSYYGIAFLRGFQVSLQRLGGSGRACQLFLFHRNLTLQASHAQRVYRSDPFPGLSLGAQYAVTVMALPVPEQWEKFYHAQMLSTRSCAEKNGLDQCSRDWYPRETEVRQDGATTSLTFSLAPPRLGISSYFLQCYANGRRMYAEIAPDLSKNESHHSVQLTELEEAVNYTCEIAANQQDAVRKTFHVYIQQRVAQTSSITPSLALPLCLLVLLVVSVVLAACVRTGPLLHMRKVFLNPGPFPPSLSEMQQQHPEAGPQEEAVPLPVGGAAPPRLLICYSGSEGPAHVRAVVQLGAFIQQHMAAQVRLDLWDSLGVAREGRLSWHCQQMQDSDFVLVVCSHGLRLRPEAAHSERVDDQDQDQDQDQDEDADAGPNRAAVQLVGEEVGRAKARGQDLSKYIAAIFEYSEDADVPPQLRLVSNYTLPRDLLLLFSHLHRLRLHTPGRCLKVEHISGEAFTQLPAGAALQEAISEAGRAVRGHRSPQAEA